MLPGGFHFWGVYGRKPLPNQSLIWIPRVRCKVCGVTHAVLPAFLFSYVRYSTETLSVYFEQAVENARRPIESWSLGLADGPQNSETLYRWLRRLRGRLLALLPSLKSDLLNLEPAFDFSPLQEVILKFQKTSSQQEQEDQPSPSQPRGIVNIQQGQPPQDRAASPPAMLSIVALCAISYWLAQNLLQLAGELLQAESALSPVAFLNYFCWQKTGFTLLSPKDRSRPP